jgi:Electron transfer flavoprotein, alpha subunit
MTALVIAEHDNHALKPSTLSTVAAAAACGGEVHVLVAGRECAAAAQAAAQLAGVAKVLHADAPHLGDGLAENHAAQVLAVAKQYTHLLAPATALART